MDLIQVAERIREIQQRYNVRFELYGSGAIKITPIVSRATIEAADLFAEYEAAMRLVLQFGCDPDQIKRLMFAGHHREKWIDAEHGGVPVGVDS